MNGEKEQGALASFLYGLALVLICAVVAWVVFS